MLHNLQPRAEFPSTICTHTLTWFPHTNSRKIILDVGGGKLVGLTLLRGSVCVPCLVTHDILGAQIAKIRFLSDSLFILFSCDSEVHMYVTRRPCFDLRPLSMSLSSLSVIILPAESRFIPVRFHLLPARDMCMSFERRRNSEPCQRRRIRDMRWFLRIPEVSTRPKFWR